MPIELEIIKASEFIRLGTSGQFDLASTCGVLTTLAQACKRRGIDRALIDARNSRAELSPTEIASLVNVFREVGFDKNQRLAILHAADRYERPRLFAFISRMKGCDVRAFHKFAEALCWLSDYGPKSEPENRAPAKRLRVSHHDAESKPVPIKSRLHHRPEHHFQVAHHANSRG